MLPSLPQCPMLHKSKRYNLPNLKIALKFNSIKNFEKKSFPKKKNVESTLKVEFILSVLLYSTTFESVRKQYVTFIKRIGLGTIYRPYGQFFLDIFVLLPLCRPFQYVYKANVIIWKNIWLTRLTPSPRPFMSTWFMNVPFEEMVSMNSIFI